MENMANKVARIPNLVDWSTGEVRILSAKCNSCGTYFFPKEHYQHRPGEERDMVINDGKPCEVLFMVTP